MFLIGEKSAAHSDHAISSVTVSYRTEMTWSSVAAPSTGYQNCSTFSPSNSKHQTPLRLKCNERYVLNLWQLSASEPGGNDEAPIKKTGRSDHSDASRERYEALARGKVSALY